MKIIVKPPTKKAIARERLSKYEMSDFCCSFCGSNVIEWNPGSFYKYYMDFHCSECNALHIKIDRYLFPKLKGIKDIKVKHAAYRGVLNVYGNEEFEACYIYHYGNKATT